MAWPSHILSFKCLAKLLVHFLVHLLAHDRRAYLFFAAFISLPAFSQSTEQLKYLFFDGYYLETEEDLRLSSGGEQGDALAFPGEAARGAVPSATEQLQNIRNYEASISDTIESAGTYDPGLSQQYLSLGNTYQQAGEYESAVTAFENAMHVQRVNEGLFTLTQIEAVRQLIDGYKNARNFPEADKYHEYLYYLMTQNMATEDDELQAATLEYADWNMEAFRRMVFYGEDGLAISGNLQSVPASMLRRGELVPIQSNVSGELEFVPRSAFMGSSPAGPQTYRGEQLFDPRLKQAEEILDRFLESRPGDPELLQRKANIIHLFRSQLQQLVGNNVVGSNINVSANRLTRSVSVLRRGYSDVRESFLELTLSEDNPEKIAKAYINLADWDLLFERPQRAQEYYKLAWETLVEAGFSSEDASAFISPEQALFIPTYISYEDTRQFQDIPQDMDIPYIGYLDVTFNKSRNGSLRNISVESVSENTGQRVQSRLMNLLRNATVRPQIVNGETEEYRDIKVRYYYSY